MVQENSEKVKELDKSAVILGEKFHSLIEIEPGDPEAQLIEKEILNGSNNNHGRHQVRNRSDRRQRARRSWDEFIPDYYTQDKVQNSYFLFMIISYYDFTKLYRKISNREKEIIYSEEIYSPLYDLELDIPLSSFQNYEKFDYEEEPDYEEAHIDQVKDIVMKRHEIRGEIETLVHSMVSLRQKSEDLGIRQLELDSILNPISELQSHVEKAIENPEIGDDSCDVTR